MDESILYDLLACNYLFKYREKLENNHDDYSYKCVKKSREKLENAFNEEQLKLIESYVYDLKLREDDINLFVDIKLLNFGVKIGMQLQKAFSEDSE